MNSRLVDMLMLVSRVHEKRGDIRFMLRQDPTVRREVHNYLDDLSWLSQLPPLQPHRPHVLAGKEQLLATLKGQAQKQRKCSPVRAFAVSLGVALVLSLVVGTQAAMHNLPAPVEQAINDHVVPGDRPVTPQSPVEIDFSTPAERALVSAGSGLTN